MRFLSIKLKLGLFLFLMIAGIAIGYVFYNQYALKSLEQKLDQVEKDWDELSSAMSAYGMDRCGIYYPPDTRVRRISNPDFPLTYECETGVIPMKMDKYGNNMNPGINPLTTPVPYAKILPYDPFNPGHYYGYTCWNIHDETIVMALLQSPGPDKKSDIDLGILRGKLNRLVTARNLSLELIPEEKVVIRHWISPSLYDPTNGLMSKGDLIWLERFHHKKDSYGWRRETWAEVAPYEKIILPDDQPTILETWDTSDPIPEPITQEEKDRRKIVKHVDGKLVRHLVLAGLVEGYDMELPLKINYDNFSPLQNHLGKDFTDFFQNPKILSKKEIQLLTVWITENPKWWNALVDIDQSIDGHMSREDLFRILPIYGKCQILLAARDMHNNKYKEAQKRLDYLHSILFNLDVEIVNYPYWYELRVRDELWKIENKLKEMINESQKNMERKING